MSAPPSRPPGDDVLRLRGETMGTTWSVSAVAPAGVTEADLLAVIQPELDAVIAVFSPWERTSEISRFNAAPAGVWALSQGFWMVLDASMDLADDTDGAVDPTLGALVDLWGFGPPGPRIGSPVPPEDEIAAALSVSGWQKLRLNRDARGAVQPGGMKLDFSGIAKGHAVDRLSDALTRLGATAHLVEIGGEMRGRGVKPDGQPWWIGLEEPPGAPSSRTVAALVDIAVATSGDWRRAFEHEGRLYPHTIDGRTGRPIDNGVTSVTVFHASAMSADAWATALTVLGAEESLSLATAHGLAAQIVVRTEAGVIEHLTPAFIAMMDEDEA
ncbi:FAD:protein FMN transferase [Brevundimonas sp.]